MAYGHRTVPRRRRRSRAPSTNDRTSNQPASRGGHPSQGAPTVGGGTRGRRPTRYRTPTPDRVTRGGHPSREGVTVEGGTRRHPRIGARVPTYYGHRSIESPAQYRRILRRQERRLNREIVQRAATKGARRLSGLGLDDGSRGLLRSGLDSALGPIAALGAEVGINTSRALVESGDVRRETLKGLRDLPAGLVAGAVGAVTDPVGTLEETIKQYERTYEPALKGNWDEFRRRMGEKGGGGALHVLADGTIVLGGAGLALGRAARVGALGKRAQVRMTAPRPDLRYSGGRGGERGAVPQDISPSFFAAGRQRRRDASRQRTFERRMQAAGNEGAQPTIRPKRRPQVVEGYRVGGEVVSRGGVEVRLPGGRSVVVPAVGALHNQRRMQRRDPARRKGKRRTWMVEDQAAVDIAFVEQAGLKIGGRGNLRASRKAAAFPTGERALLRYTYGGMVDTRSKAGAIRSLEERRDQILEERRANSSGPRRRGLPGMRRNTNDELRVLDALIEDLRSGKDIDIGKVARASRNLRRMEVDLAGDRVDLSNVVESGKVSQTQARRYAPVAELLARRDARARNAGADPRDLLPPLKAGETGTGYVNRVGLRKIVDALRAGGMERPGYWPSEKRFFERASNRAIGGSRGIPDDRAWTGALFRPGFEDVRPEVLLSGLQRSVKRKHQINLIADQIEEHSIDLGPPLRAIKAAERREAKRRLEQKYAEQRAAADEAGLTLKNFRAGQRALARMHRRQRKHLAGVYIPRFEEIEDRIGELALQIDDVNLALTDRAEAAYKDGLVEARERLYEEMTAASQAGQLERWRNIKQEHDRIHEQILEATDRSMKLFQKSNLLHREQEALREEVRALRQGERVTGAPERDAREVTWFHGTSAEFEGLPRSPDPNPAGSVRVNDLGVYLTSDPDYAGGYAGMRHAVNRLEGMPPARRLEVYVRPRKTLETRFGRAVPEDIIEVIDLMLARGDAAGRAAFKRWEPMIQELERVQERMRVVYAENRGERRRVLDDLNEQREEMRRIGNTEAEKELDRAMRAAGETAEYVELRARMRELGDAIPYDIRGMRDDWQRTQPGDQSYGFAGKQQLEAFRRELADPGSPWRAAISGAGPRRWEERAESGGIVVQDGLLDWQTLDTLMMRDAPTEIRQLESEESAPYYSQAPTRELLRELGYDSIRKVDQHADALVVLDDAIMRRNPPSERIDALWEAEANLQSAHDAMALAREADDAKVLADARQALREAHERFEEELAGAGREEWTLRAGSKSTQAAANRLAIDSTPGNGRTISELKDDLERAQVDPNDVVFINPGRVYSDFYRAADGTDDRRGVMFEQGDRALQGAMQRGVMTGDEVRTAISTRPEDFQKDEGWVAVPKAVGDEIMSAANPEALAARLWDIGKGKTSRILLGFGNFSWLAFQMASNAFLSGLFGHVGPVTAIRAQRWWNGLSPDERRELKVELGVSTHHMDVDKRYLGSTASNRLMAAKRSWEKTAWYQGAAKGNPITLMFKMDAAQNLAFRRTLLYKQAKRDSFERMGESIQDIVGLGPGLKRILSRRPDDQIASYLSDRRVLEAHGRKVDELLGDYSTYTHQERRVLQRYVMFYGFMRHSLRLAFWTLPTKHPIMVSILAKLALMGQEEARELLGGDDLPWGLGKFYFRGSSTSGRVLDAVIPDAIVDVPDTGQVMELDFARMSPATNALLEIRQPSQIARVFPPIIGFLVEGMTQESLMTGRDWNVQGMTAQTLKQFDPTGTGYTPTDIIKSIYASAEELVPPARYAKNVLFTGPQGADSSLLFGEAETRYREDDVVKSVAESKRRREARSPYARLGEGMFPIFPRPSEDPRIVKSRLEREREAEKARRAYEQGDEGPPKSAREVLKRQKRRNSAPSAREVLEALR
jgi:hypothetical protein